MYKLLCSVNDNSNKDNDHNNIASSVRKKREIKKIMISVMKIMTTAKIILKTIINSTILMVTLHDVDADVS